MKKEELEKQNTDLTEAIQRVNDDNRKLTEQNKELIKENNQLKLEINAAIERVRYLDGQLRMKDAQKQAFEKYNDFNRNY